MLVQGRLSTASLGLLACLIAWHGAGGMARADRVVLLPVGGTAAEEARDAVEEALADAAMALGHEVLTEMGATEGPAGAPPTTANELRAIADMQRASYVVVATVVAFPGQYRLGLRVGYAPIDRVEEIEVNVLREEEGARLRDVLGALLRADGLGEDAVRLTEEQRPDGEPSAPPEEASSEPPVESSEERAAREAFLAREQERREQAARDAAERWEQRERYGSRAPWMVSGGVDVRPLVAYRGSRTGGVLGGLSLRMGRALEDIPGFEIRGAVDLVTGATSGFGVAGGVVHLFSPWEKPVFLGVNGEVGFFQALSGNRVPSLMVRLSPVAIWRAAGDLYVEAVLPELMYLSANEGALTLGVSVRVGTRF